MRHILLLLFFASVAFGQSPARVSPDDAIKHLVKKTSPDYPALAERARIQGNIIIEIGIDESGSVSSRRFIKGHPMLASAAMEAVSKWKYQPFDVNGKPTRVVTVTMVRFGNPSNHDAEDRAEMMLQHNFWSSIDSARVALGKKDLTEAEEQLNKAGSYLPPATDDHWHQTERWQLLMHMGSVRKDQQKYDEAEQYFQKALDLWQKDHKEAPEVAAALANLSGLYADRKQYDAARDYADRSIAIYEKNFKVAGSGNAGAREFYGRAIAYQAWTLSKWALQKGSSAEAGRYCQEVSEFRDFIAPADHESVAATCPNPSLKPSPTQ
jgi:TonB family protein